MTSAPDQAIITIDPSATQIIPDNRVLTRQAAYLPPTPLAAILDGVEHVRGTIAGLDHRGVEWLRVLVARDSLRSIHLVLALFAGGPTWDDVLRDALEIQRESGGKATFRLLARRLGPDRPANLLWIKRQDQATSMVITGNVSNALIVDQWDPTDATLAFPIDAVAEDALRKWFDLLSRLSHSLTHATAAAPRLRLPDGSEEGASLWCAFLTTLDGISPDQLPPLVDADTGEVQPTPIAPEGRASPPATPPSRSAVFPRTDPVLLAVQRVLAKGALVSIERVGRSPPLAMPVRSELFGELALQRVGSVSRRQAFSVSLFDDKTRKVLDGRHDALSTKLAAFSLMLREGQRWMPHPAFALFDAEIADARAKASAALLQAIGVPPAASLDTGKKADAAGAFVAGLKAKVTRDLADLAAQIGARARPTQSLIDEVLSGLQRRLEANLDKGMVPNVSRTHAQLSLQEDENQTPWGTVQTFLASAARLPRQVLTDPFRMRGLVTKADDLLQAFNPFEDPLVREFLDGQRVEGRARDELQGIDYIEEQGACTPWQRAQALYRLIKGEGEAAVMKALTEDRCVP